MTIDNLNCLLKKFTFLQEHHPLDRSTSILIGNEYIDISIVTNSPSRSLARRVDEESLTNEYDIFPVIKDVLSYFGLTHKNFSRLVINKMTRNAVKFVIYTSNFWNVGKAVYEESGHSQKIEDLIEGDLPIPLSKEKIDEARAAAYERIKSSFRYYTSYTSGRYQYLDLENLANSVMVEPISVEASISSNGASLNF